MFVSDFSDVLLKFLKESIRIEEEQCGKGIKEQENYWARVGMIRGYKKTIEQIRQIEKKYLEYNDDEV